MVRLRKSIVCAVAASALFVPAACSSSDDGAVGVTLADFSVTPKDSTAKAGDVTFKVKNEGAFVHELVVFRIDKASDIPTNDKGEVNEDDVPEADRLGEVEDVDPGKTKTLKLELDAGKYVLFCNRVDGTKIHFHEGMHVEFTVT